MKKFISGLILVLGLIIFVLIGLRLAGVTKKNRPVTEPTYGQVGSFHLTNQLGNPVSLSDLRGHVWVANFIFSRCMGPCPLVTSKMASLQKQFHDNKNIRFVSFSVDPDFDTPAVLKKYADSVQADPARWFFLTGDRKLIYDLIHTSFHLAVEKDAASPNENDIVHSLHLVVIDRFGVIRGYYNSADENTLPELKSKVAALLDS